MRKNLWNLNGIGRRNLNDLTIKNLSAQWKIGEKNRKISVPSL